MLEILGIIAILCNLVSVIAALVSVRDDISSSFSHKVGIGKFTLIIRIAIIGALLIIFGSLAAHFFESLDIELL